MLDAVLSGSFKGSLLAKGGALDLQGLTPLVVAADGASVVRTPHRPALRASSEADERQCEVTAALALTGLRVALFGEWGHF